VKAARSIDRLLFDAFLFAVFVTLMILALQLQPLARELPLPVSMIGVVVTFILLLQDMFPNLQNKLSAVFKKHTNETVKGQQGTHSKVKETEWKNILRIVLWLIVFVVALQWTNFKIATALFVFLVSWIEGQVAIRKSVLLSIGTTLFFYVLFDLCLNVTF
jgi:small-conductance mechanosensitive channel